MDEPLVSIVILNFNGFDDLEECFSSIEKINYKNREIIFVDNNSTDDSVRFIKTNYKYVKIIELEKNYGFAKGNNVGASYAKGDYIILLNNDTIVDKNWLTELVNTAKKSKKVGIVGSKIYYYDDRKTIDFAGSSNDEYGYTSQIGAKMMDNKLINQKRKAFYACGASILFKKNLYERIGLFDPNYFIYYEDVDFCWRAWLSGFEVYYEPKSFIYHKIGRVIKSFKKKRYLLERNRLRTILKNYEFKTLRIVLPRFFYRWGVYLRMKIRREGKKSYIWFNIYIKAILWNLININSLITERIKINCHRIKNDDYIFKLMKELKSQEEIIKNLK